MIDFDIDINKPTPYKEVLISLQEQSHALRTIHNSKTWRLSALTYALHLNDCLVLFSDLKERWQKTIPFDEAWDVDLGYWKSEIWSAALNTSSITNKEWKSLCDSDYTRFINLLKQFKAGEIPLTPLIDFVEDKDSHLSKIIKDIANNLCELFQEIESVQREYVSKMYSDFFDNCVDWYKKKYDSNPYYVIVDFEHQPFEQWKASKTEKALPNAIGKQISSIIKDIVGKQPWSELWEECYDSDSKEINHEGIGRHLFNNRKSIISNTEYKKNINHLIYSIVMVEFLQAEHNNLTNGNIEEWVKKLKEYIKPLKDHYKCKDYDGLWNELISKGVNIKTKSSGGISNCFQLENSSKGIFNRVLVLNILGYMLKLKMFDYQKAIEMARELKKSGVDDSNEKTISGQINSEIKKNATLNDESKKKFEEIIQKYK